MRIFRVVPESPVSVGQKIHAESSSNGCTGSASDKKIHAESSSNGSSWAAFAQILVRSSESPQISFGICDEQRDRLRVIVRPGYREDCMALPLPRTAAKRRLRGTSWFDLCTRRSCTDTGHFPFQVLYFVMDRAGTSVRSTRKRRGAKPLAVAAAARQCRRRRCGDPEAVCCGSGNLESVSCLCQAGFFGYGIKLTMHQQDTVAPGLQG